MREENTIVNVEGLYHVVFAYNCLVGLATKGKIKEYYWLSIVQGISMKMMA